MTTASYTMITLSFTRLHLRSAFLACLLSAWVAPLLAQNTTPAISEEEEPVKLDKFVVVGEQGTRGYATTNALGGTRINAPIADTPFSVISLNQEFLKDINPTNFADALRFISGMTNGNSLRGMDISMIGSRDGIDDNLAGIFGNTRPDPIEVERIEVIKGPAGAMYGAHNFGGVINRVSKRPLEVQRTELGLEYTLYNDSEGFYRAFLDTTGPIDADKKFLYRVLAAYQDGTTYSHGLNGRQTLIGTLEWRPAKGTTLWLRVRDSSDRVYGPLDLWTDSQRNMPFGFLPRNAYVGNFYNDDSTDNLKAQAFELGATHAFNLFGQSWDARLLARYNEVEDTRRAYISSGSQFFKNGAPLMVGTAIMSTANTTWLQAKAAGYDDIRENILRRDTRNGESESYSLNFDLTGDIILGPTKHTLLLYAGKSEGESEQHRFRENWIAPKPSVFTKTSVPPSQVLDGKPQTLANEWTTTNSERDYFAVQDNIGLLRNRLNVVGALRYDSGTTRVFDNRLNVRLPAEKTTHWTPTYGIVGKPAAGVSLFYLHSETFQPQGGVNQAGDRLRPLIGENDEVGVKLDLFRNRLVATGSYFNMEQENAFLKVIYPDGSFDYKQTPLSVHKGWEMDLAAQPTDNVTLLASYQWIDARTESGLAVRNVPQGSSYSAVAKYSFLDGLLKGLDLGLTYNHINDSRAGDATNQFFLPGYDLIGAFATYQKKGWRIQFRVENMTDEWYVAGTVAQQFMTGGPPLNSKLTISRTF